jgi:hypothetical protein
MANDIITALTQEQAIDRQPSIAARLPRGQVATLPWRPLCHRRVFRRLSKNGTGATTPNSQFDVFTES